MNRLDLLEQIGDLFDVVAGDAYEGWDDYWPDRDAEVDGIIQTIENWQRKCASMIEALNETD